MHAVRAENVGSGLLHEASRDVEGGELRRTPTTSEEGVEGYERGMPRAEAGFHGNTYATFQFWSSDEPSLRRRRLLFVPLPLNPRNGSRLCLLSPWQFEHHQLLYYCIN